MITSSIMGAPLMGGYGLGYALGAAPDKALQDALNALSRAVGDGGFRVVADGIIGPGTTRAVNRASKYLTEGPQNLRSGDLTVPQVKKHAIALAEIIHEEIRKRKGGKAKPSAKPSAEPKADPRKAAARTLQKAIRALGAQRNDPALKIQADGIVGPGTTKAANRALTRYVKDAPGRYRTGKMSRGLVRARAAVLATHIEREIARYKKDPAPSKAPAPEQAEPRQVSKAAVRELQSHLRTLSAVVKDAKLKIAADGIVGPRTAAAVNTFLAKYAADKGGLSAPLNVSAVKGAVGKLSALVKKETARRLKKQKKSQTTPTPSPAVTPPSDEVPTPPTAPAPTPDAPSTTPRVSVARLQRSLRELGKLTGDASLAVDSDGVTNESTVQAVNKAFRSYISGAPSSLQQKMSAGQINALSEEITQVINSEISKRVAAKAEREARQKQTDPVPQPPPKGEEEAETPQRRRAPAPPPPRAIPASTAPAPDIPDIDVDDDIDTEEEKAFPWWVVGVGVGALALGGLAVAAFSPSRRRRREDETRGYYIEA